MKIGIKICLTLVLFLSLIIPNAYSQTDLKQTELSTVTPALGNTFTGLQSGGNVNFAWNENMLLTRSPTAWRLFYVNASGIITEIALGASGTYLKSNGASSAPSFDTPEGTGAGDIIDVWACATGNCNALTAAAGDSFDASLADTVSPFKAGNTAGLPGTCTVNQTYHDTQAKILYLCTTTNTWTVVHAVGADGSYKVTLNNNSSASPTASANELYFEGNIIKVNQNGTESSVPIGPTAGQITFVGPTATRTITVPDANFTVGSIGISSDADGMSAAEMAAVTPFGMYGTLFLATGAGTWILPTAVAGMSGCLRDTGTAHDLILDIQAGDDFQLLGVEDANGDGVTNAAGSTTGDFICFVAISAGHWISMGQGGAWVAQ